MKTKTDESKEVKSGSKNKIKSKPDSKENTEEKKLLIETLPEELLENILKLIDKIKDSPENNDKRDIKGLKEIAGSLKNLKEALLKMQGDQKGIKENSLIKENLDKLQLLLEKFDTKKSGKKIDIKKLFTQVKKSLEKLETLNENILSSLKTGKKINIPGRLKNRGRRKVTGAESHNNQKVESEEIIKNTIIETSSHENNKSNDGNKQSLFNFNNMKNIKIDSGNNTPSGKQANNSIFRQQLNSILENAKVVVKDGKNGSFSVKLYPKKLGNINVNLGLDRGVIHGKFIVESQEAKELLTQNLSFITQQLKEAGISVGSFEVNVSDRNNMFYNDEENAAGAMDPDEQEILINEYDMNSMAELSTGINLII